MKDRCAGFAGQRWTCMSRWKSTCLEFVISAIIQTSFSGKLQAKTGNEVILGCDLP